MARDSLDARSQGPSPASAWLDERLDDGLEGTFPASDPVSSLSTGRQPPAASFTPGGEPKMPNPQYAAYKASAPYFDLVRSALGESVDGDHFFDIVADDVVYEVLYDLGWPRVIHGRAALMAQFAGYGDYIQLHSADHLIVHKADNGQVVVIEYQVHGTVVASGAEYNNRFASIIRLNHRKIAHWRDYMDSLAAWNALTSNRR
jgi:ketosteroid isomerase-like protein